jgi:MFS family permease
MLIYYVFALAFLNMTSVRGARVVLTLDAIHLGAEPFVVGLLAAMFGFFPAVLAWFTGRLSDRFGSRWPVMIGAAAGGAGIALPYFVPGMTAIFAAAAMNGIALAFCTVSLQNVVGLLSTPQDRAKNYSNYHVVGSTTQFLGPLLAGFAIDYSGYGASCLYFAALAFLPVMMVILRGHVLPGGSREAQGPRSIWSTLRQPGIPQIILLSTITQTGTDIFQFYLPVHAHDAGLSATVIGAVLSMFAVAGFAVRLVLPRLIALAGERVLLSCAFCAGAVCLALIPFFRHAGALGLLAFCFGLGMGCSSPITMTLIFAHSAGGRSGEALGLRLGIDNATRLVAPVIFGSVASAFGLGFIFWINAAMLGAGSFLTREPAAVRRPTAK